MGLYDAALIKENHISSAGSIELAVSSLREKGIEKIEVEVENKEDLELFATKLEKNNIEVNQGKNSFADKRFVEDLIYFNDPQGNRVELVYKPMNDTDPFKPGRPISGFKTGALGMGHAVVHVKNTSSSSSNLPSFYRYFYDEDELPEDQIDFIEINARLSEVYENITEAKDPLPEAEKYETVKNKRDLIGL